MSKYKTLRRRSATINPLGISKLLLVTVWMIQACGSSQSVKNDSKSKSGYAGQPIEVRSSFYLVGGTSQAPCPDGGSCQRLTRRVFTDECLTTIRADCVPPPYPENPDAAKICRTDSFEQKTVDAKTCINFKESVFDNDPSLLEDRYVDDQIADQGITQFHFTVGGKEKSVVLGVDDESNPFPERLKAIMRAMPSVGFWG